MNVLLIIIDCLRADRLAQAERLAPNLHRLAQEGCLFTRALTNGPYTKAAMPALLYSAYYSTFLARRGEPAFCPLPEVLRGHGFKTLAVQTNAYLASQFGWGRGFDHYDESILPWLRLTPRRRLVERPPTRRRGEEILRGAAERALLYLLYCKGAIGCRSANRKLRALLRQAFRPGRRHFALLHYMDLHEPVVLPRRYRRGLPRLHPHRLSERAHASPESLSPEEWRFLAASYDAALGLVDDELGRLLESPEARAFLEEAALVITADHGEELGERGCFGHHTRFYEPLLRVPLIIKLPGQREGRRIDSLVCHLDLAPTLLDLCSLPPEAAFAGQSLAGLIEGTSSGFEERPVIAEAMVGGKRFIQAVRTRRHKLITDSRELYDLVADPGETLNLYEREPELARQLEVVLARHRLQAAEPPGAVPEAEVGERMRERLRGLGYLD